MSSLMYPVLSEAAGRVGVTVRLGPVPYSILRAISEACQVGMGRAIEDILLGNEELMECIKDKSVFLKLRWIRVRKMIEEVVDVAMMDYMTNQEYGIEFCRNEYDSAIECFAIYFFVKVLLSVIERIDPSRLNGSRRVE